MYEEKRIIGFSECDYDAKLNLYNGVKIVEDVISRAFKKMGYDNISMRKEKNPKMWILAKSKLTFLEDIYWNEEVTVTSRPIKVSFVKCFMLTEFYSKTQTLLARAIAECCIYDMKENKVVFLRDVDFPVLNETSKFCLAAFSVFPAESLFSYSFKKEVTSDYIDYSRHMNNAEYIRLISSSMKTEELKENAFKRIEITYLSQTLEGDYLSGYSCKNDEKYSYILKRSDGSIAVMAQLFHQ
ncbi:MAG: hypothetical protein H6687_02645 [Bacillales bacterium]|nr:hypothetical protein [Bacillales bacterium]